MSTKRWFLGNFKDSRNSLYLYDFEWNCGWYWGGGYLGNSNLHCHFDSCFLKPIDIRGHSLNYKYSFITPWDKKTSDYQIVIDNGCSVWEPIETFLDNVPDHISKNWWRIKDLFKQFYALRDAAEVFKHGGNCTPENRKPDELNEELRKSINEHIEKVIIREIRNIFNGV